MLNHDLSIHCEQIISVTRGGEFKVLRGREHHLSADRSAPTYCQKTLPQIETKTTKQINNFSNQHIGGELLKREGVLFHW